MMDQISAPNSPTLKRPLAVSAVIVAAMAVLSLYATWFVPDGGQIPIHWSASGEIDRYTNKLEGLGLLPAITVLLIGLFAVLPKIDPRAENIVRSAKFYQVTWIATLVVMALTHFMIVMSALGTDVNVPTVALLLVVGMVIAMGNYLPKTRSNFFMGIRTPWTLSSEAVWTRTHRLGGKLFVAAGALALLTFFIADAIVGLLLLAGVMLIVGLVLTAYSYLLWREEVGN